MLKAIDSGQLTALTQLSIDNQTMQFTLGRMFAITMGISILLAVGLWATANWRRQLAIQDNLRSQGASWVGFDSRESDLVPNVLYTKPLVEDIQHHERLRVVEFKGFDVTPQCIQRLGKLKHIGDLRFISCEVCDDDLIHLPQLEVSNLLFWNASISDSAVDRISQIQGLKKVSFKATLITPEGIERLKSVLPEVKIVSVQ